MQLYNSEFEQFSGSKNIKTFKLKQSDPYVTGQHWSQYKQLSSLLLHKTLIQRAFHYKYAIIV